MAALSRRFLTSSTDFRLIPCESNFVFLHRDADSRDPALRYDGIHRSVQEVRDSPRYVAVVPVQETEAWLLLDESKVRSVPENPGDRVPSDLPSPSGVKNVADPKAQLGDYSSRLRADRTARTDKRGVRSEEETVDAQARSRRFHLQVTLLDQDVLRPQIPDKQDSLKLLREIVKTTLYLLLGNMIGRGSRYKPRPSSEVPFP